MKRTRPRPVCLCLVLAAAVTGLVACGSHTTKTTGQQGRKTPSALPSVPVPTAAPCGMRSTGALTEGPTDFTQHIRPQGTIRPLMIFVDFPDAPATEDVQQRYDSYAPARDWYRTASYGRFDLRFDPVMRWIRMPRPSTAYQLKRGYSAEAQARYIHDAVAAAKSADPSIDLAAHPLVEIVATLNAKAIKTEATSTYPAEAGPIPVGDAQVRTATTFFGDDWKLKYRVVVHETGHIFGLPDLYPATGDSTENTSYVGENDVMGEEIGAQPDFLAWHKQKLGWLAPGQIDCVTTPGTTEHHISPVETAGGTKMTVIPNGPTSAVAVEVRAKEGVDREACRTGVLVYSVDTTVPTGEGPIRVAGADSCSLAPTSDPKPSPPQEYQDTATGTTIAVRSRNHDGSYHVTVTKT